MSDALAKAFHHSLSEAVGNDRVMAAYLHKCGWVDFVDNDRPETDSHVEMAVEALIYLGLDKNGCWINTPVLISAIIGHLRTHVGTQATVPQLISLGTLLKASPIDQCAVRAWFEDVYS